MEVISRSTSDRAPIKLAVGTKKTENSLLPPKTKTILYPVNFALAAIAAFQPRPSAPKLNCLLSFPLVEFSS